MDAFGDVPVIPDPKSLGELTRSLTEGVAKSVSVKPEDVFILIHDVPLANSAKAGVLRIDR